MGKFKKLVYCLLSVPLLILALDAKAKSYHITETHFLHQESDTTLVVHYIAAASCGFSTQLEVIEAAKRIPKEFDQFHDKPVRFVFISMDRDLDQSLEFMEKHGKGWDEASLGERYHNQILLKNFNNLVDIPGTPHIIVFKDVYSYTDHNIPHLESREKLKNIMGAEGVIEWVDKGYPVNGID